MDKFVPPSIEPLVCDGCGSHSHRCYKFGTCGHLICMKEMIKDTNYHYIDECQTIKHSIHKNPKVPLMYKCFCGEDSIMIINKEALQEGITESSLISEVRPQADIEWLDSFIPCKCNAVVYLTYPSKCSNCKVCWDNYYFARTAIITRNELFNKK